MAKWHGNIVYAKSVETKPGIWRDEITERHYTGDLLRNSRRLQTADKLTDDINIANEISIVADPFANENLYSIKYVEFMGAKWKVTNIDVQYPRLVLTLGGVYNG